MADQTTWSRGPTDSRELRWLVRLAIGGGIGAIGFGAGLVIAVLAVAVVSVPLAVLAGAVTVGAFVASGVRSLDGLERRPRFRFLSDVDVKDVSVIAVATAGLLALVLWLGPAWGVPVCVAAIAGVGLLVEGLTTDGELDTETRTLTTDGRQIRLDETSGVRSVRLGSSTVVLCTFTPGSGTTPMLFVVPESVTPEVLGALGDAVRIDSRGDTTASPERLATYGMGGLLVFVGLLSSGMLWASQESVLVAVYVAGSLGTLGTFFFLIGRYEV